MPPIVLNCDSEKSDDNFERQKPTQRFWSAGLRTWTLFPPLNFNYPVELYRSVRKRAGKECEEPIKPAVRKSRPIALYRALIHVIPLGFALAELCLNWMEMYVGPAVRGLNYYQYAAKAHEILMQASLANVMLSYIRHQILLGRGLPFGTLFSALQINQVDYLWSMEFWASIQSGHYSVLRRMCLFAITFTGIFLAALVGPSSAILLIPRLDYWPAGSTHIWLNATTDSIWPLKLNETMVPEYCSNVSAASVSDSCPASEWQAIRTFIDLTEHSLSQQYGLELLLSGSQEKIQLMGHRKLSIYGHNATNVSPGLYPKLIQASTPQSLISDALLRISRLYNAAMIVGRRDVSKTMLTRARGVNTVHAIKDGYYQPYTGASCGRDVIHGLPDDRPVYFPLPYTIDLSRAANMTPLNNSTFQFSQGESSRGAEYLSAIQFSEITRSQLLETPGNTSEFRLKFVELPQHLFNGSAIGAVVLHPKHRKTQKLNITVCTLAAGWGTSLLNVSVPAFDRKLEEVGSVANKPGSDRGLGFDDGWNFSDYPEKRIIISEGWANSLNPSIPSLKTTVIHALMLSPQGFALEDELKARIVLSGLLANALARTAFDGRLQGTIRKSIDTGSNYTHIDGAYWLSRKGDMFTVDPAQSKNFLKLEVITTVEGYAYSTRGAGAGYAIVVILTYCIVTIAHLLYTVITGISSTSWGSTAEVTALAMNSTPTEKLRNTCAGITKTRIYKLPVRILAAGDGDLDGEHLELVFGEVDEEVLAKSSIKVNRAYGTMARKM